MIPDLFSETRETDVILGPVVQAGMEALKVLLVLFSRFVLLFCSLVLFSSFVLLFCSLVLFSCFVLLFCSLVLFSHFLVHTCSSNLIRPLIDRDPISKVFLARELICSTVSHRNTENSHLLFSLL